MRYAIVFSSKTGNTKLLADTLHDSLPQDACSYFGAPDPAALHGKKVFLFGTAGFGGSEGYFNKILKTVQKSLDRSNTLIGSFMCQGKMPLSVRQRYEAMKKQPIHMPNLDMLIENFDKALSHPDADDLARLKQAVR